MKRREGHRFTKRLESTFAAEGMRFRGISSDISAGGLFIRTQHALRPGTVIDIEIFLSDQKVSRVKGIVRRSTKTPVTTIKNGMGVQLIEKDSAFGDILKDFGIADKPEEDMPRSSAAGEGKAETKDEDMPAELKAPDEPAQDKPESVIITCRNCNVKNRVLKKMLMLGPKCGKCGGPLDITGII